MTSTELLKSAIDDSGYQLDKVIEGFPIDHTDARITSNAMTPREALGHLCEAYHALLKSVVGEKYEWGSYSPPATDWEPLVATWRDLRTQASEAVLARPEEMKEGISYIVAHDYYHVGQLCLARIEADHGWDPYSIYSH